MGFARSPQQYYDHDLPPERTVARRTSVSRKASKNIDDRERMPPPPRPSSAFQSDRKVMRAPPPARKSVGFEDDDLLDTDSELYHPIARRASVEYGAGALQPRSRQDSLSDDEDESYIDDYDKYQMEPASISRRTPSYNYEDKIHSAARYQNDVGGPAPLTAETLKRVKNGGSRGSTRSSESRDESDYKHSATTRTTRSASAEDDITIKLPEGAVVEVNGAKITVPGGGDVSLGRNNDASRGGSDRGTSVYEDDRKSRAYDDDRRSRAYDDDRKSRHDRLPIRTRASSQAAYPRALSHAPPLYPQGYPPYPGYAPSYYDSDEPYYRS